MKISSQNHESGFTGSWLTPEKKRIVLQEEAISITTEGGHVFMS